MRYVCADIHGQYDSFEKMLSMVGFSENDELYILGDVLDRGPKPIDLLLKVLGEPNMHLLMGNHENMMIRAARYDETRVWINNGCRTTIAQLKYLPDELRANLVGLLEQLPLVIPDLAVGERTFYLTHAGMVNRIIDGPVTLADLSIEEQRNVLWSRQLAMGMHPRDTVSPDIFERYRNHTVLFGHTMTYQCPFGKCAEDGSPRISPNYGGTVINVDCGCALGKNLGFLRLEDMREFYV